MTRYSQPYNVVILITNLLNVCSQQSQSQLQSSLFFLFLAEILLFVSCMKLHFFNQNVRSLRESYCIHYLQFLLQIKE